MKDVTEQTDCNIDKYIYRESTSKSKFYDTVDDLRELHSNEFIETQICTKSGSLKGSGEWQTLYKTQI